LVEKKILTIFKSNWFTCISSLWLKNL